MSTSNDSAIEAAKLNHASKIIAERNQVSSLLFFAFFCSVLFATPFFPKMPKEIRYLGAVIFALSLLSFFVSVTKLKFLTSKPSFLRWAQYILLFLLAVSWSGLCIFVMQQYSLGWASFFIFLVSLCLSAVHLSTLQPNFWLLCVFQAILLLPISWYALFQIGSQPGQVIGWFFAAVFLLTSGLGYLEFRQFWKTESDRSLLLAIFDSLPGTLARLKTDLSYVSVNQRFADLFEKEPGQFEGETLGFAGMDGKVKGLIEKLVQGEKERSSQMINIGKKMYFMSAQKYNFDKEIILLGVDMTDQFLVQDQLEFQRAQTMNTAKYASLGEVLASFAGDIISSAEKKEGDQQALNAFKMMHQLGQSESGKEKNVFSLRQCQENLQGMVSLAAKRQGVEIVFSGFTENIKINACEEELYLLLLGLVKNSFEALKELEETSEPTPTKKIEFTAKLESGQLQIAVADSGPGVPEYLREVVFEPAYTTKEASASTGVGLSVGKSLAEKNGGSLKIQEKDGKTLFVLNLPLATGGQGSPSDDERKN